LEDGPKSFPRFAGTRQPAPGCFCAGAYGAYEDFNAGFNDYALAYGSDIIKSIPPGSLYFGESDWAVLW